MSDKLTQSVLHDRWTQSGSGLNFPEWVKHFYPTSYSEFFNVVTKDERVSGGVTSDKPDMVNHPPHYASGEIECIDAIKAQMNHEEYIGYLRGNIVKYMWRWRNKGGVESIKKARWYMDRLIDEAGNC